MLSALGFSLLETTVAIAILITAIIGPLTLASSSIKASATAKNNLIAANLAQEGVELVKNHRANNVLAERDWLYGFGDCLTEVGCTIDALTIEINLCGASCEPIKLDEQSGLYSYGAGNPTIFARKINLVETVGAREVKIKSAVSWTDRFGAQKFELEAYMLNW